MSTMHYNITMQTPIGFRHGTMSVETCQKKIRGILHLLNHSEAFQGIIDEDGRCQITGQLITLMRTIHYQAVGTITQYSLHLSMQAGKNTFKLTGTACSDGKEHSL